MFRFRILFLEYGNTGSNKGFGYQLFIGKRFRQHAALSDTHRLQTFFIVFSGQRQEFLSGWPSRATDLQGGPVALPESPLHPLAYRMVTNTG